MAFTGNTVFHIDDAALRELIVPRFLRYVAYWTTSDPHVEETPSTPGQWELAKALAGELSGLGIRNVELTRHCYVIARLSPSPGKEGAPVIGFLAHMDTADDVSGRDVKAHLVEHYDGKRIRLAGGTAGADGGGEDVPALFLDPASDPDLAAQKGKAIIHTDGATLLGADDKAGIAEIMAAAEYLAAHPEIPHGPVEIIFSPDEETGKGLPCFPLEAIKSKACFTLDGGPQGELEIECFNAWKADVVFTGKVIHLGTARGILANAALMAACFACMLPRSESPEASDGCYGYYCPAEIRGSLESARLEVFLRDFDEGGMKRRLEALETFAGAVEAQFPGGKAVVNVKNQYCNMKQEINKRPEVIALLKQAFVNCGIECREKPIRGGTDGSRLTELGIPTPNIFTGGRNFHSRLEWVSVPEMTAAAKIIIELIRLWGEK
ncbi:MAG: peptidase T [Treponema sp.]|jgi:tripeptide aminopeptidase|nr:peptidase T [Treponema sp.]